MATQCKLCGLHIPGGVRSCMMCGRKNLVAVAAGETITPSLPTPTEIRSPNQAKFSSWLWAVAISLVAAPFFRVLAMVLYLIATTAAINSLFPDASMTQSYISLTRSLIWAGAIIPYLLTSGDIRNRFVN